jgi:hypothetical protein
MKSWSFLRKFGFCATLIAVTSFIFAACRVPDWRVGIFSILCLLFFANFATLYLLFRPHQNYSKTTTMPHENLDGSRNDRVRTVTTPTDPVPTRPTSR